MKKYLKISYLLNFLTILIFGFLFLDSFFYSGFSQKHLLINLKYFLILYLVLIFVFFIFKKISISKKLIQINKFFFPIVFLLSILFLYLEKSNYTNFVYTYFHLNQINFLYIPLISGFIFFLYNNQISKAKSYYLPPIIATCLSQYLSFNQNYDFYTSKYQIVLVINYFLWLIVLFLFTSFFKKRYYSLVGFLSFFLIFNLINRLKIKILNQFFTINDFYLIKELKNFIPSVIKGINLKELLITLVILFLVIFLIFIFRNKSKTRNPSFKIRILLFIVSVFVLIFPIIFPIQFGKIIDKSKITIDLSNPIQICRNDGILFCFYYDFKNIRNIPPENYSQQTINQIYSDIKSENLTSEKLKPDNKINIVVILSEAFWDATKLPIKYSQDPIKNIRSDIKSSLISPVFGNMTANVEFEILTGFSNYFLNGAVPYSQSINKKLPTLFTQFKEQGYLTTAIHPYYGSMYNRPTVYKYFGLDKFISIENMNNYEKTGNYVSEKSFTNEILKQLNSTDQSQLIFALSMQNHYPFEDDRFPDHKIEIKSSLESKNKQIIQTYTEGINLSDKYYQVLKEEIIKSKKPTIVIFYGDHLPLLADNFEVYKKLNFDINNQTEMHSTPIAVWANFKNNLDIASSLSPNFLSLEILKLAKIKPKYQFSFLQSLSQTDKILNKYLTPKFSPEQIKNYELIQHDLIFGKQYSLK